MFWDWFGSYATAFVADIDNPARHQEIDKKVRTLNPGLSWEVGPGRKAEWQFVISPSLDRALLAITRKIVSKAPQLDGWEFFAARQPKVWNYKFEVEAKSGERIPVDASGWRFVLLKYPDRTHEILLCGENIDRLGEDALWHAGAIVLESILGEEVMLSKVDSFSVASKLEARFVGKEKPIQALAHAFE
jgi:hypothetical protein